MRVLFVCSGNVKGFEIVPFIKEQGEGLRRHGVDVDYYPIIGKGISGYLKAGLKLRKELKSKKYDVIHGHFTLSGWAAVLGARNTPVVLSLMGSDAYGEYVGENKVIFTSRYLTLLTWLIQPFVKAIISKSANIEKYVYQKSKSHIIPNGIDTQKFHAVKQGFRTELGLNQSKKQILFLGSKKSVRKNISLVQQAMQYLNPDEVELINPYPVAHSEVPKYLNSAHVLAVCSYMEGSPNVVKEAMACNCPMVATDIGDVKWVLGDTPGCYLSSFNPKEYAEKLKLALAFSETQGRTKGEDRIRLLGLDSDTIANRVIEVYKKAIVQHAYTH